MSTKLDPDDEFFIPEIDFSIPPLPNRFARQPDEKTEIFIDGAVAYQLRLIPSNRVIGRFGSTLEAWPAVISTVESGRSPRTLSLDAVFADGTFGSISAGPRLEGWARLNDGGPQPYPSGAPRSIARRVAEGGP